MKNGEPNSLARIPLRWMVRESFKVNTGIIFDSCMLKSEIGLDMEKDIYPTWCPPDPLPPSGDYSALTRPGKDALGGFSFRRIPVAVISALGSPFRWAENTLQSLTTRDFSESTDVLPRAERKPRSDDEAEEELKDALSPIFDQMKIHPVWKVLELVPCKFCSIIRAD